MLPNKYFHLGLPLVRIGKVKSTRKILDKESQEARNRENHIVHAQYLSATAQRVSQRAKKWLDDRNEPEHHPLPPGTPLIVRTEIGADLEFLRSAFDFEIVAEHENGYVLVSSEDIDLAKVREVARHFETLARGGGSAAKIYEIVEDSDDRAARLERILSEDLLISWPSLADDEEIIVDLGISCHGKKPIPSKRSQRVAETDEQFDEKCQKFRARMTSRPEGSPAASPPKQRKDESDEDYRKYLDKYDARLRAWWEEFDELLLQRESEITSWVESYGGAVIEQTNKPDFPDSFTVRVRLPGKGLRDIVLNHPHLFEVTEIDNVRSGTEVSQEHLDTQYPSIEPPDEDAPLVVIVDSGIQEEHPLIHPAIRSDFSISFVPNDPSVADLVRPNGHGTRVAGAAILRQPDAVGEWQAPFFIGNARVLDGKCELHRHLVPQDYVGRVVTYSMSFSPCPKIFNHSISSVSGFRTSYMSTWAASIDAASYKHDILFVQAAGNLAINSPNRPGRDINAHLARGSRYPDYLLSPSCRVSNPAQSFQALTVGSLSAGDWVDGDKAGVGAHLHPSAFTTSGHGIWGSIKPDVVEVGGDLAIDSNTPRRVAPHLRSSIELPRTTFEPGGLVRKDGYGTSFAAPRVTGLLAEIQKQLPGEPALLYRALVALSARWPEWAETEREKLNVLRLLGFGLPDGNRALHSTDHRVTLITNGHNEIGGSEAHIYRIPIPITLRQPSESSQIRIDVALSYAARPRRTRRSPRGYLSTWARWKSSCKGESYDSFAARIIEELEGDAPRDGDVQIDWMLRETDNWGSIQGVNRNVGTLQKDWAVINAYELPQDLCIAVFGHKGWDKNSEDKAKYSLAVSIESLGASLEIYSEIEAALKLMLEANAANIEVSLSS